MLLCTFGARVGVLAVVAAHNSLHCRDKHHLVVGDASSLDHGGVVALWVGLLAVRVGVALVLLLWGNLLGLGVVHHL